MLKRLLLLSSMMLIAAVAVTAQEGHSIKLKDKRITIQMTEKPLFTIFARLTIDYDIPIGLEESILDMNHHHYDFETAMPPEAWRAKYSGIEHKSSAFPFSEHLITLNFTNAGIDKVMNKIVEQMVNYDWEIKDEVINVFPIKGRDKRLKELMDVEISSFYVGAGERTGAIQAQLLLFLPEIKKFLKENKLEADTTRSGPGFPDELVSQEMRFKKIKLRDLLNAVTKIKRGGWIVRIEKDPDQSEKQAVNIQID